MSRPAGVAGRRARVIGEHASGPLPAVLARPRWVAAAVAHPCWLAPLD